MLWVECDRGRLCPYGRPNKNKLQKYISLELRNTRVIEITIPYANGETTLQERYNGKKEKYRELLTQCEETFNEKVELITVVVSSLGAIFKESKRELKSLLQSKTTLHKMLKKIVIATLRESMLLLDSDTTKDKVTSDDDLIDDSEEEKEERGDELGDNAGDLPNWQRDIESIDSDSEVIPEENPIFSSTSDLEENSRSSSISEREDALDLQATDSE